MRWKEKKCSLILISTLATHPEFSVSVSDSMYLESGSGHRDGGSLKMSNLWVSTKKRQKLLHTSECEDTVRAQRSFSDIFTFKDIHYTCFNGGWQVHACKQTDLFISLSLFPPLSLTPKPLIFGIPFTVFTGYHSGNRAGVKPSLSGMKGSFCEQVDERGACSGHMDWRRAIERGAKSPLQSSCRV